MNAQAAGTTVSLRPGVKRGGAPNPGAGASLATGRVLRERYVILEQLGAGGRGTVYKACDRYRATLPEADQHVALKILHADGDSPDQSMEDLARELQCGRALSHRNIVNVFELDRDETVVFFTMELLEGELLRDLMDRMRPAPVPSSQAWAMIRQLGEGLQHAHERGVVHGDLKPRNLFVTRKGELRILDFGAAQKSVKPPAEAAGSKATPTYGTPAYASCEQLEGRTADHCDDLYAFAVISYELLAGVHPFGGRPANHARNYGVRAERPPGLNGKQWQALQAGLSWHRSGRSMPVQEWVRRLTAMPRRRPKRAAAAAAAAMLLIAALGLSGLWHRPESRPRDGATGMAANRVDAGAPLPEGVPSVQAVTAAAAGPAVEDGTKGAGVKEEAAGAAPVRASPASSAVVVDGYHVSAGDRFVEVRVHRNQLRNASSFVWWTEPATARQNVDYVHQSKAVQTFPTGGHSTRLYVKLLPDAERSQRDYFYLAIAPPGSNRTAGKVTRAQIWLPTPHGRLQASR